MEGERGLGPLPFLTWSPLRVTTVSIAARRKARKLANVAAFRKAAKHGRKALSPESRILAAIRKITAEGPAKNSALHRLYADGVITIRQALAGQRYADDWRASQDTKTSSLTGMPGGSGYPDVPTEKLDRQVQALMRWRQARDRLARAGLSEHHWAMRVCLEEFDPREKKHIFGEHLRSIIVGLKNALDILADHYNLPVRNADPRLDSVA